MLYVRALSYLPIALDSIWIGAQKMAFLSSIKWMIFVSQSLC